LSHELYRDCPTCPELKKKIDRIDLAIVGPDLQGGLVAKVQKLETFMKITTFISSAAIIAAIGLAVKALFG